MDLTQEETQLLNIFRSLHKKYRDDTYNKYKRINPFIEDIFDWKERGKFWTKHDNVTVYNSTTIHGDVKIGKNTWIGPYCSLDGTAELVIGDNCSIALGCQILTHDSVKWALSGGKSKYESEKILIGNCCFLGSFSVITKGIKIGDHSLVGANAVVTKSFPPYSIIAGVPAKKIGKVIINSGDVNLEYF